MRILFDSTMECFRLSTKYIYPFHPIMLLEEELHRETRASGVYSRLHPAPVETRSPLPGRTTTESKSREFGHAFVMDRNSGDVGLVADGAIGKVDCHDR